MSEAEKTHILAVDFKKRGQRSTQEFKITTAEATEPAARAAAISRAAAWGFDQGKNMVNHTIRAI